MNEGVERNNMMSEPSIAKFHGQTFGNRVATYCAAIRPPFLTASLLPVVAALAMVGNETGSINVVLGLLTMLNIALIHSGANVVNDYFDSRNGTDSENQSRIFPFTGGSRFIQNGVLTEEQTFRFGFALIVLGAMLGIGITVLTGPFIVVIGLVGGLLAVIYSAPPCLACRGLGDITIGICFGILPVIGTVYIQTGQIMMHSTWLGAVIACFVVAILWVNSIPDIEADEHAGKRTWPVRLGARWAAYGLGVWFAAGFAILLVSPLPAFTWFALLAVLPAVRAGKAAIDGQFTRAIPATLVTHSAVCVLLVVGYALD